MDKQENLRGLIEGAILGAIWLVMLIASIYTPLFLIGFIILPIPFTIIAYRRGIRIALISAFVAVILSILFNLLVIGFSLVIYSILLGITSGYCFQQKKQANVTFTSMVLAVLGSNLLTILIIGFLTDYNIFADLSNTIQEAFVDSESLLGAIGLGATITEADIEAILEVIRLLLPTILIAVSVLIAYVYYHTARYTIRRLGEQETLPTLPSIAEIQLPKKILWYYIFATIGMIYLTLTGSMDNFMYTLLLNIVQILSLVLAVQGIGLVWYYMNKKNWSKVIKYPIVIILLHPILLQIMTWVGMFDIFFNWRKLPKQR
ncbi:YybS family protein [Desulfuribacillus alkaliarsenatis]|uniref:DUF2232 domain-containing protein n=1 Tax=Desulfuribacillus alkaliarsenatis TaxID=766136 RepID=A0A1E5G2N7_9FIRM|nr:DUF2232 domain-containing protein [Desulfuribacillus alkaliarsenatis]OEF97337.1 hypothetical protein BHF68_03745 [Desulfuribacillus alkaliarsenatis]